MFITHKLRISQTEYIDVTILVMNNYYLLNNINEFLFIVEAVGVHCKVRTELLQVIWIHFIV